MTDPTEPRAKQTRPLSPILLPWAVRRRKRGRKRGGRETARGGGGKGIR